MRTKTITQGEPGKIYCLRTWMKGTLFKDLTNRSEGVLCFVPDRSLVIYLESRWEMSAFFHRVVFQDQVGWIMAELTLPNLDDDGYGRDNEPVS